MGEKKRWKKSPRDSKFLKRANLLPTLLSRLQRPEEKSIEAARIVLLGRGFPCCYEFDLLSAKNCVYRITLSTLLTAGEELSGTN